MRIEDNWKDVEVYFVGFYVNLKGNGRKLIKKTLVFECGISNCDMEKIIKNKFPGVCEVVYVDIIEDSALKMI